MAVGYCTIQLRMPENGSLKGKRQVLRSLTEKMRGRFNVAVAEIADQDTWQLATLGVVCVSTSGSHCHEMLESVVDFVQEHRLDAELLDYTIEIVHP